MNNLASNFSEDMSKYIVTVPALHTTAAGARITLPPVTFVFDTSSNVTVANVVAALQQYVDEHKVPHSHSEAYICTWLERNTDLDGELVHAFEHALRKKRNLCRSLGYYLCNDQGMNLSRDAVNGLRLTWTKHCITELVTLKDKEMTKEMNKERDHSLLRPVVFANLKVGDKLVSREGREAVVVYMGPDFAVIRFQDNTERIRSDVYMKHYHYGLAPLCWVEDKPVYPGDGPLYYKHDTSWKHNEEGVITSGVRDDELHFHGGIAFPIADATWIKPEQKPVPSFQVEGQDVFPGDTVYYYGDDKHMWGRGMIVEKDSCVNGVHAESFAKGVATFRLKPMLVIGDRLVPMPVRNAAEMKKGDAYYTPCIDDETGYLCAIWDDSNFDIRMCDKGLVHLNKEAAVAHTEAFIALSKRRPEL